jgi:hypothetical protein
MYCPPGTTDRVCSGGSWGTWSKCAAGSGYHKYYGDGGTWCGPVVCMSISPTGSDSSLAITFTKVGGIVFDNNTDISLQPYGSSPVWYYCVPTAGKTSYTLNVNPADYVISLGDALPINAWVWSPCGSSVGHQTDDAYISQCKP